MAAFATTCSSCTGTAGQTDILTVSLGEIHVDLLGINVDVCPICIRVYTTTGATTLTPAETAAVKALLTALQSEIGALVGSL